MNDLMYVAYFSRIILRDCDKEWFGVTGQLMALGMPAWWVKVN